MKKIKFSQNKILVYTIANIWLVLSLLLLLSLLYLYVDTQTLFQDRMFVSEYFKQGLGYISFWTEEYVRTNGIVVLLIKIWSIYLFILYKIISLYIISNILL